MIRILWCFFRMIPPPVYGAAGFADEPVFVDHYKNGKLIAAYSGWVTSEWWEFDNPDGFSRFVIRKPGTSAQTPRRGYVPDTGVR